MKAYIGVDPGASGAACLITDEGLSFIDFKGNTSSGIVDGFICWKTKYLLQMAVVEAVGAMPGNGTVSMFSFGLKTGWVHGVLDGLYIPWCLVSPRKWQSGLNASKGKLGLVEVAERMFPGSDFRGPRGGMLSGRADAALIAMWSKRNFK